MGDWLGTYKIASFNKEFKTFEKAKAYIQTFNITSANEWREFCKSANMLKDISAAPYRTYKNSGWINWEDWLGTTK